MSLFNTSTGKGAKFPQPGATVTGKIAQMPFEKQATKFGTNEPDFWPNGDPKNQVVVPLTETNAIREDGNDDGDRTLYVSSSSMKSAISQAIQASGQQDVAIGGTLTVTYVGDDPNSKNPANPKKLYQAQYTPPVSGFAQPAAMPSPQPAAAPAQAPQQAYVQQAAVSAQPVPVAQPAPAPAAAAVPAAPQAAPGFNALPAGVTQDQADKAKQLLAIGTDMGVITTVLGLTADQVTHVANGTF